MYNKGIESITVDSSYNLAGPLTDTISHLQSRARQFEEDGWKNVTVDFIHCYEDSIEIVYSGIKPMTLKEFLESDKVEIHENQLKSL